MAYTMTDDISRMIVEGQKDIFTKNFDSFPLEYPSFTTPKTSNKAAETYDSMGNLKAASRKIEGSAIQYGKVEQAYQTTINNYTYANGYEVTLEATKFDLYGVVNSVKAKELARTMRELEENNSIAKFDNAFATNLADGVPLCSASKPLINSALTNSTLATASSLKVPENHKTMIKQFSAFLNHAGGKMKSYPTDGLTHSQNMMDIEEIYGSDKKANEISNTKNSLPRIAWHYSTYLNSTSAWFMWDRAFEHVLFQTFMDTEFDSDEDKRSTKNMYLNAIAIYGVGVLPNIGIVGNAGA
jgi:hypothetical protein